MSGSTSLVAQLRFRASHFRCGGAAMVDYAQFDADLDTTAADRIEALEAALRDARGWLPGPWEYDGALADVHARIHALLGERT